MIGAAKELTEVVTDIAVEMKLINSNEADAAADKALYVALATFGKASSANMPEEERQQYAQHFSLFYKKPLFTKKTLVFYIQELRE